MAKIPILSVYDENGNKIEIPAIRGANGVTPHVGANGNWFLGETDTGVKARCSESDITSESIKNALGYTPANNETVEQLSETKADRAGWTPDKFIGTDAEGNLIEKDAPTGGGSGTVKSVNGYFPDENGNVTLKTLHFSILWKNVDGEDVQYATVPFEDLFNHLEMGGKVVLWEGEIFDSNSFEYDSHSIDYISFVYESIDEREMIHRVILPDGTIERYESYKPFLYTTQFATVGDTLTVSRVDEEEDNEVTGLCPTFIPPAVIIKIDPWDGADTQPEHVEILCLYRDNYEKTINLIKEGRVVQGFVYYCHSGDYTLKPATVAYRSGTERLVLQDEYFDYVINPDYTVTLD